MQFHNTTTASHPIFATDLLPVSNLSLQARLRCPRELDVSKAENMLCLSKELVKDLATADRPRTVLRMR